MMSYLVDLSPGAFFKNCYKAWFLNGNSTGAARNDQYCRAGPDHIWMSSKYPEEAIDLRVFFSIFSLHILKSVTS